MQKMMNTHAAWQSINTRAYEGISPVWMRNKAKRAGLVTGCDIDLIMPYINKPGMILDVGTGYGRSLAALYMRGCSQLYGIEISRNFYAITRKRCPFATVIHDDFLMYDFSIRFDHVLLLWSFIMEFGQADQRAIIQKSLAMLKSGGSVVLDFIPKRMPVGCFERRADLLTGSMCGNQHLVRLITFEEIVQMAAECGGVVETSLPYATCSDRHRQLMIIRKV